MMFGWLKKRAMQASSDAMNNDILKFIAGLKGASSQEIATIIVIANIVRLNLMKSGTIPSAALDFNICRDADIELKCDMCSVALVKIIKQFQKMGQLSDATGTMVWLHSVRSLNVPEIRAKGREMWGQLERGFPYVDDALMDVQDLIGEGLPDSISDELTFVPRGLEPRV